MILSAIWWSGINPNIDGNVIAVGWGIALVAGLLGGVVGMLYKRMHKAVR